MTLFTTVIKGKSTRHLEDLLLKKNRDLKGAEGSIERYKEEIPQLEKELKTRD